MTVFKTIFLFAGIAVAEIIGCYLPYLGLGKESLDGF
jgi:Uncharacterised BCR, YnfA/UPF0060 family.